MAKYYDNSSLAFWLVTQPDGSHYILFTEDGTTPYRGKDVDEDTHAVYDVWTADKGFFVYPVSDDQLPQYLLEHSWDDEPFRMSVLFFPQSAADISCQFYTTMEQCWKFGFSKSTMPCSGCLGARCKTLTAYKTFLAGKAVTSKSILQSPKSSK